MFAPERALLRPEADGSGSGQPAGATPALRAVKEAILRGEARALSFTLLLWFVEDFLWFVFNPKWGVRRFRRDQIWWHAPKWWWFMPRDYWTYSLVGGFLYAYSRGAF